ncbi:MAG: response regulator transcription factor [Deltaproteobacteria bacterium]|nr:response regulator transcription factor [Deltaproteobacteria bacterium]MBW2401716.1 response regulator transcription factor [Deltaproteobacteria bacterium]
MSVLESTVFVVDDDEDVRRSLGRLLKEVGLQVEAYANAEDFLEAVDFSSPGCVLLDIRMPGMSGIELHKRMLDHESTLPIIMITGHGDVTMAVESMKRGAFDFIEKPFRAQRLLDSVQAALRLERRLHVRREARAKARGLFAELTASERDVIFRVAQGLNNREIAEERSVSSQSVDALRSKAMRKLGVENVADLVRLYDEAKR